MRRSPQPEREAALKVAELMSAAARTSPKTRGIDQIDVAIMDDKPTIDKLIAKMKELSRLKNRPSFERDANSIGGVNAIVLIGVGSRTAKLDCGFCGYSTCASLEKSTGVCAYASIDLGIAVGSAISVASSFHIDNRVMYSIGAATLEMGIFGPEVRQVLGIPLSVTGKNPFFDR